MVVGCHRKAIYKKSQDHRTQETERGYCSEHRALAATAPRVQEGKCRKLLRYLDRDTDEE